MTARPVYVAVIGWVLILLGGLSLALAGVIAAIPDLAATIAPGPSPSASTILINLAASALELVCGVFILRGANWARLLYLAQSGASALYLLFDGGVDKTIILVWLVKVAATLAGLFTPAASRFFGSGSQEAAADEPTGEAPNSSDSEPELP